MIVLGLTGSIGMGKSTTAQIFRDEGVPVFDADATVHELYSGEAAALVGIEFPDALKNNRIDRATLARILIESPGKLKQLEIVMHPLVRQAELNFIQKHRSAGAEVVVLDIPLLFETKGDEICDKVVVVTAPLSVQKERVMARPGMTKDKFEHLLGRQMTDEEKRKRADFLICTDKGMTIAKEQVKNILHSFA